jgi:hypothetical protein
MTNSPRRPPPSAAEPVTGHSGRLRTAPSAMAKQGRAATSLSALLVANLETVTANARLCNRPLPPAVASALHPASSGASTNGLQPGVSGLALTQQHHPGGGRRSQRSLSRQRSRR